MLIGCICKDYEIMLDGKPFVVQGEKMVGSFSNSKVGIYFRGVVYDEGFGDDTVMLSKEEFEARVDKWVEILCQAEKFDQNYYQTWKNGTLLNQKEVDSFAKGLNREPEEIAFRAGFIVGLHKHRED
jgi:hypothetical protein